MVNPTNSLIRCFWNWLDLLLAIITPSVVGSQNQFPEVTFVGWARDITFLNLVAHEKPTLWEGLFEGECVVHITFAFCPLLTMKFRYCRFFLDWFVCSICICFIYILLVLYNILYVPFQAALHDNLLVVWKKDFVVDLVVDFDLRWLVTALFVDRLRCEVATDDDDGR